MKLFGEFVTEKTSGKDYIVDLENHILKINFQEAYKKALKVKKTAFYFSTRENLNIWADQNGYDVNQYQRGSQVDVLRNYSYGYSMMSDKIKSYIAGALDYKEIKIDFEKTFQIDAENSFTIKYIPQKKTIHGFPSLLLGGKEDYTFERQNFNKYIENLFEMQINGTGVFSWNKYRNRKGVSPEKVISKRDLSTMLYHVIGDAFDEMSADTKYRPLVTLQLVDEVIGKFYIKDTKELVQQMKSELRSAKSTKEVKNVLDRYEFSNVPKDDILDNIINSENFEYDSAGSGQYGHSTGTLYSINFERRVFNSQGYSSDD